MINTRALMIFLMTISSIAGCQPALINVPDCPKPSPQKTIAIPPPIQDNVLLELKDGRVVKMDEGGENLVRDYVATRKALKAFNEQK